MVANLRVSSNNVNGLNAKIAVVTLLCFVSRYGTNKQCEWFKCQSCCDETSLYWQT